MPDRARALVLLRLVFLVVVATFIWLSLRGRWAEVRAGFEAVAWWGLVGSLLLTIGGLVLTGFVWIGLLGALGPHLGVRDGFAVFFPGQLGKYIPGSVWSFGAQAHLAREHRVPARTTVAASLVFLGFCLASAGFVAGVIGTLWSVPHLSRGWSCAIAVGAVGSVHPWLIGRVTSRVVGFEVRVSVHQVLVAFGLSVGAWGAYALATLLLAPHSTGSEAAALTVALTGSFIAGVLVFLAPAGLGAREATFVAIAAPATGLGVATAVAVLSRVLFLLGDLLVAAVSWAWARQRVGTISQPDGYDQD